MTLKEFWCMLTFQHMVDHSEFTRWDLDPEGLIVEVVCHRCGYRSPPIDIGF